VNQIVSRQDGALSAIAQAYPDRITVRGTDLCEDLIGSMGFTSYFLFLLTGEQPSAGLLRLVDASLVAIAEHGMVPSVVTARATLAAAPEAIHGAVAAGLLGCGSVILGAAETAGDFLDAVVQRAGEDGDLDEAALASVGIVRASGAHLPGFGHPIHKPVDPRATKLVELSRELGLAGRHVAALEAVSRAVPLVYGKPLTFNVSGAIPAVLLDVGFPRRALKGIPLVARSASLVAHLLEEQLRPIGMKLADAAAAIVRYDGPLSKRQSAAVAAKDGAAR
jgi:citrate synthase